MQSDQWFPSGGDSNVVGRFIDAEVIDKKASEKAKKNRYKKHPLLQSKVAGSHDISAQIVKPFNQDELKDRFPGAWDHYQSIRSIPEPKPEPDVIKAIDGTPLHESDFLPREKMPWLKTMGFSTIEQIAEMSDATCQNLGRGALSWRKKAKDFLKRT